MSNNEKEFFRITEGKLYSYNRTKAEIEYLNLEIEEIQNEYKGLGSINYEERTGKTYNITSSVEKEIINKEKDIYKKNKEKNKKSIAIKKIDNALTILTEEELKLVEMRYFNNKTLTWETIGRFIGVTVSRCKQMRIEIIDKIKDLV